MWRPLVNFNNNQLTMVNNKSLQETTYRTAEINSFLESQSFPYAASILREKHGAQPRITATDAAAFFKSYFMDVNQAQYMFRKMQTVVTGHMELA
jgi:hypothetical protein